MKSFKPSKVQVSECDRRIPELGSAIYTFGNVSAFDPDRDVSPLPLVSVEIGMYDPQ
ncbi:MAG: hypothetical protein WBW79_10235 [Desulfocapsaceae bacterium]|jgi:hypothetical protein